MYCQARKGCMDSYQASENVDVSQQVLIKSFDRTQFNALPIAKVLALSTQMSSYVYLLFVSFLKVRGERRLIDRTVLCLPFQAV